MINHSYRDPRVHLSMLAGHLLEIFEGNKKKSKEILLEILSLTNQVDLKQKVQEQGINVLTQRGYSKDFFRDVAIYNRKNTDSIKENDATDVIEKESSAYLERREIEPEDTTSLLKNILS